MEKFGAVGLSRPEPGLKHFIGPAENWVVPSIRGRQQLLPRFEHLPSMTANALYLIGKFWMRSGNSRFSKPAPAGFLGKSSRPRVA
jgi:hypothetical protein